MNQKEPSTFNAVQSEIVSEAVEVLIFCLLVRVVFSFFEAV